MVIQVVLEPWSYYQSHSTENHPEAINALNRTMLIEIGDALEDIEKDNPIRVLIIRGSGKASYSSSQSKRTSWVGVDPFTVNYLAFYVATVIKLEFQS